MNLDHCIITCFCAIAKCETENLASARVMQKSGMEYEGTFYDADFEGIWANRYRYKITSQVGETL